jgi:hypothetical protein
MQIWVEILFIPVANAGPARNILLQINCKYEDLNKSCHNNKRVQASNQTTAHMHMDGQDQPVHNPTGPIYIKSGVTSDRHVEVNIYLI